MRSERALHVMSVGRELQEEGTACAKAPRWEHSHSPGNRETSVAGAQWPKWGQRSLSQGDGGNMDNAGPFKAIAWTLAFFSK